MSISVGSSLGISQYRITQLWTWYATLKLAETGCRPWSRMGIATNTSSPPQVLHNASCALFADVHPPCHFMWLLWGKFILSKSHSATFNCEKRIYTIYTLWARKTFVYDDFRKENLAKTSRQCELMTTCRLQCVDQHARQLWSGLGPRHELLSHRSKGMWSWYPKSLYNL